MDTEVLNQETADLNSNQSSQAEGNEGAAEGAEGAQQGTQQTAAAPAEKSAMDKLRDKSDAAAKEIAAKSVNVAAKKPSEIAAEAAAIKKFEANFKFKAAGKDMEVPEYLRGVIKDEETQKHLHSLLSKAHGIEMIQDKLKSTRERVGQVEQAYHSVMTPINHGREAYQRGDMDMVFNILKIDANKVLQWAYQKVQLSQLPPEQRMLHERATSAQRRTWELEQQQVQASQQHLQSQSHQIEQMMELVLERPDVAALAQQYDSRKDKPGAFRELVAMMGDQEFSRTGKVIHPLKAAEMAAELLGEKFGAQAKAQATPAQQAQPAAAVNEAPAKKIVLPNAGGSKSAAPAKAKVKTLDDIRRLSKQIGL